MTMISLLATILTVAIIATVGNAANVMDQPLPFSIYPDNSFCTGTPLSTGVVVSVKPLRRRGNFCENTIQKTADGEEITVYTKVKFISCEAVSMGYAFLDAFTCTDAECSDCTDADSLPVEASLVLPKFTPLPAADTCWGVEATSTGVTVLNQFDASADPDSVDLYWKVFMENSCLRDTVEVTASSTMAFVSLFASTTVGVLLVASLLY